jgi:hypothetical protein
MKTLSCRLAPSILPLLVTVTVFFTQMASLTARAADSLRGFIHADAAGTEIYLNLRGNNDLYKITSSQPNVLSDLRALKENDFLIASGAINAQARTVSIDAIESVGLQRLLGLWRTAKWQVFEFRDFNRVNLYSPSGVTAQQMALEQKREFSYVLAPDCAKRYSILLSDDHTVHAGSLQYSDGLVQITMFDTKTGQISEEISLLPVPPSSQSRRP